jgi:hypothetical protein
LCCGRGATESVVSFDAATFLHASDGGLEAAEIIQQAQVSVTTATATAPAVLSQLGERHRVLNDDVVLSGVQLGDVADFP